MEALSISEIIIELLLSCDIKTAFFFASTNSRLLEVFEDDYHWKERLKRRYPDYDTSSHEGESFKETYLLIDSGGNIRKAVLADRVDLLIYFAKGRRVDTYILTYANEDDHFVYCAMRNNSTKILRWAAENGYKYDDRCFQEDCKKLSVETMKILCEFDLVDDRWHYISDMIFSGGIKQIKFLLDRDLADTKGLLENGVQLPASTKRRKIIEYGFRELYERGLLSPEHEYEAILLLGEEERFSELPTGPGRLPLCLRDYIYSYGPESSVDWMIKEKKSLYNSHGLTIERMSDLLKRGLSICPWGYSDITSRNLKLLVPILDHGAVSETELFLGMVRSGCRPAMRIMLNRGFHVDSELLNEWYENGDIRYPTKCSMEKFMKEYKRSSHGSS